MKATIIIVQEQKQIHIFVTKILFESILTIIKTISTYKSFNEKIKFPKSTFNAIKKDTDWIRRSTVNYVEKSLSHILSSYSSDFFYNQDSGKIEHKTQKNLKQFNVGTYYGYFKKTNDTDTYHFVLLVKNEKLTIWSRDGVAEGQLTEYSSVYSCVLTELKNEKKQVFLIGKNSPYSNRKFFIATWSTHDNDILSALCGVEFIPNSPYKTVEQLDAVKRTIRQDIVAKTPKFVDKFFREQNLKFIKKDNSNHEYED